MLKIEYYNPGGFRVKCNKTNLPMEARFICLECRNNNCYVKKNLSKTLKESIFRRVCDSCGAHIDWGYFLIINQLREAGLLPEDHKTLCCGCFHSREMKNIRENTIRGVTFDNLWVDEV